MRIDRSRLGIALLILGVALFALFRVYVRGKKPSVSVAASASAAAVRAPIRPITRAWQSVHLSGAEIVESEDPIGKLSGHVVSSDDERAIPKAELTFVGPRGAQSVQSADDGSFTLSPEAEGSYELTLATAAGHLPLTAELGASPITLTARKGSGIRRIRIHLSRAISYRALVLDPTGAPVPKANVRIYDGDDFELGLQSLPSAFVADGKGEIVFRAPDGAILEASHTGFSPGRARLDLFARQARLVRIRLGTRDAERALTRIVGRVIDESGTPVAEALVQARVDSDNPASDAALTNPGARAHTDLTGEFVLADLGPGRYLVAASEANHAPARVSGVVARIPTGPPITLILTRGARLSGRVTDQRTSAPIPAFSLALALRDGPLETQTVALLTSFDAEGRYNVERLARGTYIVTVAAGGFAPAEREIVVQKDETADFVLGQGASAFGFVKDATSRAAIAEARVQLEGRLGSARGAPALLSANRTDASGRFELTGIAPGDHSLFASAAGHHARVLGALRFHAGQRVGPIEILLTPTKPGEEPRVELVGIGAVLAAKDDVLVVGKLLPGGGAEAAGLAAGDAIVAVDGVPVAGLGFEGSVQRIRGPENTSVVLLVKKASGGEATNVSVVRRRVQG
jgi:protocatechuate 3,4-dioxygenase beta subunit